mmetsp:Transcript_45783/g.90160  ORF Transcript_45783/g.90160 Transcript_45783/m.90160 type:complete len:122 (-) Transcript_45783:115-480(-)
MCGVGRSMVLLKPHILFLDEPTNHLDIESINALIAAICTFDGGVVMVSHDARLIAATGAKLWLCQGNGKVQQLEGGAQGFEQYRVRVLRELREQQQAEEERLRQNAQRRALKKAALLAQRK